jgi:hypothetical protein
MNKERDTFGSATAVIAFILLFIYFLGGAK